MNQGSEQKIGWNRAVDAAAVYLESWGDRLGEKGCPKEYSIKGIFKRGHSEGARRSGAENS